MSEKFPAEVMTTEEVAAILGQMSRRAPTGIRNRALVTLLYRSGLRISEAVGESRLIAGERVEIQPMFAHQVDFREHAIRLPDTKSGKAQVRGFHPTADDALLRWIDVRKSLRLGRSAPFFCTLDGTRLQTQYVRLMLHRVAAKAGVPHRVNPHAFRHTFAVELVRSGADVVTISKLLGHSSIAVTSRYLDHLTNSTAIERLQAVDLPELAA